MIESLKPGRDLLVEVDHPVGVRLELRGVRLVGPVLAAPTG